MRRVVAALGSLFLVAACSSHPTPASQGYTMVGTYQGVTFWQRNFSALMTTGRLGSICNSGGPRGYSRIALCNDWTSDGGVLAGFVPSTAGAARAGSVELHIIRAPGPYNLAVAVFGVGTDPATLPLGPITLERH